MSKMALACSLVAGALSALPTVAAADDVLARFKGGIGVIPVSSGVVPQGVDGNTLLTSADVSRNFVRNVQPAGQVWVIDKLDAKVQVNGHITVEGKGLVLAGGNNAGRTSGQSVFATLICQAAAPFTQNSTTLTGVPLTLTGDFRIDDMLSPAPSFPCASPMLLIRSTGTGNAWFAAGILRPNND